MISCLTITHNRYKLLLRCIEMFKYQTFEDKQMVIVYYSDDIDTINNVVNVIDDENIKFVEYDVNKFYTLGELRNLSLDNADGEYIATWDDDDIFHSQRLELQYNELIKSGKSACTLRKEIKWFIKYNEVSITPPRNDGWENTLLCRLDSMPRYIPVNIGEDSFVLKQIYKNEDLTTLNIPYLYIYAFHGNNTVPEELFLLMGNAKYDKISRQEVKKLMDRWGDIKLYPKYPKRRR